MADELHKSMNTSPEDGRPQSERELASRSARDGKQGGLPPTKARQGARGLPVLLVLIAGLILAALAWWGAEIYGVAIAPENPSGSAGEPAVDQ